MIKMDSETIAALFFSAVGASSALMLATKYKIFTLRELREVETPLRYVVARVTSIDELADEERTVELIDALEKFDTVYDKFGMLSFRPPRDALDILETCRKYGIYSDNYQHIPPVTGDF